MYSQDNGGGDNAANPAKLFIGNLPWSMTQDDIDELFGQYGTIVDSHLATHRDSGRSRGFAFVTYESAEEAEAAIEALHGHEVDGRDLRVSVAQPKTERPRRNNGGGYNRGGGGGYNRGPRRDDR